MLSEDGVQSAGGCAQQTPEARNAKMIAAFFMDLLLHKSSSSEFGYTKPFSIRAYR
jgi:hypothetical protein